MSGYSNSDYSIGGNEIQKPDGPVDFDHYMRALRNIVDQLADHPVDVYGAEFVGTARRALIDTAPDRHENAASSLRRLLSPQADPDG